MSARGEVQEWQRLAWAMAADDICTDEPANENDPETHDWRDWAEKTHGARARDFIASFDALLAIRGDACNPRTCTALFEPGHGNESVEVKLTGTHVFTEVVDLGVVALNKGRDRTVERALHRQRGMHPEAISITVRLPDGHPISDLLAEKVPSCRDLEQSHMSIRGSNRDAVSRDEATHDDSPSVVPGAGHTRDTATVGEGDGAGRAGSPPAAPSPNPDLCAHCGEPHSRHSSMVRGPDSWACYFDGAHPDADDLDWLDSDMEAGA